MMSMNLPNNYLIVMSSSFNDNKDAVITIE